MIHSVGQLLERLLSGRTIALDLSGDHPAWRVVETGERVLFDPTPHVARWPGNAAIAVIQRDLLGAPYQLGAVTPPRGMGVRRDLHNPRGPERASGINPSWRGRRDTCRPLQLCEVNA